MKNKLLVVLLFVGLASFSQIKNSFVYQDEPLSKVLFDLEKVFDVKFSYIDNLIVNQKVNIANKTYTLKQLLNLLEESSGLYFEKINDRYYAILKKNDKNSTDTQMLAEVVLQAYLTKGITKHKESNFNIIPGRMELLPGLTEPDVLQILQQLPGVISPNETAAGLHVRGGTPDQNLVLFDGITMYHNGHLFGMISGFNPNTIQLVKFYNKGTNARYGGRVSSVIDLQTNDKIPAKTTILTGINALDIDLLVNTPLIKNKMNIQVSARRSFTDIYPSYTFKTLSQKVFQNTKISETGLQDNQFYFQDYTARFNYQFSKNDFLSLSAIIIDNNLDNAYTDSNSNFRNKDVMNINNKGYSFSWEHRWSPDFSQKIAAYYSKYRFNYDNKEEYSATNYDLFIKKNKILDSGISVENTYHIGAEKKINFGYQLSSYDVSHAFLTVSPSLSFVLDQKSAFVQAHSLYGSFDYDFSDKIDLHSGLRFNYYSVLNKSVWEPRLVFNYNFSNQLTLSLTGEIKNQIISQIKETVVSDLNLENQLWILSDEAGYPIIKSKQLTSGIVFNKNHWTFDLDLYQRHTTGLTTLTFGFLNPSDPGLHIGESDSQGVDFYVKKGFHKLQVWLTYSYNNTKTKFDGINNNRYFPFNSEIKHAVNLSTAYKLNKFQFAFGWYWRTGKPYTQAELLNNTIVFDEINGERLPPYHRLDFSALYEFSLGKEKHKKGKAGFSIYNVYNQKNLLNREFSPNQSIGNPIQIRDKYSLRFTPNVFLRLNL